MAEEDLNIGSSARWAHFRFSVIGQLLACPPPKGELQARIEELAARRWTPPGYKVSVTLGFSTIERWYYRALRERDNPVQVLRRKPRGDRGEAKALPRPQRELLAANYSLHRSWSYQLHYDNLRAAAEADRTLGPVPSYATVRRYMKAHGLLPRPRRGDPNRPGVQKAELRLDQREVRSWEVEQPNALWHLDFHGCSRTVLDTRGEAITPQLLGIIDDHSRLCCHLQWYLSESAENLVHGLCQAFQKRGLPRALMTDNGSAMTADETCAGLARCSIVHETTLPASPYQNGKQESFWGQVEGRLMSLLERDRGLTLEGLNEATQAWVEMEYNRKRHSETGAAPLTRWLEGRDAGRPCPSSDELRLRFTQGTKRRQRRSDGTISLESRRFEVPARYRHLEEVGLRYASWDLSRVWLWDRASDQVLARIFPLDRSRNADGQRRALEPLAPVVETGAEPQEVPRPALLEKLIADYRSTGLPPAYLPKPADLRGTEEER